MTILEHRPAHGTLGVELVRNGSIELSDGDTGKIAALRELLPFGAKIYVRMHADRAAASLDCVAALHDAGFDPIPHIAARRIRGRTELGNYLRTVASDYGVRRILLIGGDVAAPSGPYGDCLAVLQDGLLEQAGIREVGIAGYPDNHPQIPAADLQRAFEQKLELLDRLGLGSYVVTQFCFSPSHIVDYCASVAHSFPDVPVYVGVAGPADKATLVHFARICGVSVSLLALKQLGFKAVQLVSHDEPNEQLEVLARYRDHRGASNVIGVHVFCFGGVVEAANWMRTKYA